MTTAHWSSLALVLTVTGTLAGQAPPPSVHFTTGRRETAIAFADDFHLVFTPVRIQRDTLWFILDTGFEFSILDAAVAARLDLEIQDAQDIPQPGGTVRVGSISALTLRVGSVELRDHPLRVLPLAPLGPVIGRRIDGLIGHDILAEFVVEIDYAARTLTLRDRGFEPGRRWGPPIPVRIDNAEPLVAATIRQPHRGPITGWFKLDTGSLDAAGLNRNFYLDSTVLAPGAPTFRMPGVAVGGETDGLLFRVQLFELAGHALANPVVGVTLASEGFENRADAGTIGAEVLRRFTLVLDYPRERIFLAPNAHLHDPFPADLSGMWLRADGADFDTIRVHWVAPESPAAEAGIEAGDLIESLDGQPVTRWRLAGLWTEFRTAEGSHVLRLRRSRIVRDVTVRLRRYY